MNKLSLGNILTNISTDGTGLAWWKNSRTNNSNDSYYDWINTHIPQVKEPPTTEEIVDALRKEVEDNPSYNHLRETLDYFLKKLTYEKL